MSSKEKEQAAKAAAKIGVVAAATYFTGGTGTAAAASGIGAGAAGVGAGGGGASTASAGGGGGGLSQAGAGPADIFGAEGAMNAGDAADAASSISRVVDDGVSRDGVDGSGKLADPLGSDLLVQRGLGSGEDESSQGTGTKAGGVFSETPDAGHGSKEIGWNPVKSALGQGGTSMIDAGVDGLKGDEGDKDGIDKGIRRTAAGATAVGAAGPLITILTILAWLKSLFLISAQALVGFLGWLMNLVIGAWNAVMGFFGLVGGFFAGAGAAVGSFLGASAIAGTMTLVGGIVIGTLVLGGGLVASTMAQATTQTSPGVTSCTANAQQVAAVRNADANGVDTVQLKNAQTAYSVLAAWGMPKENIAGILGNWQAESGIDPTSVQNNSSAPFQMTDPKKSDAANTVNGIGLGQWTAGRNTSLRTFASGTGKDWWTVETQLAYMMSPGEGANADVIRDMIKLSEGSPGAAALYFHQKWERSADDSTQVERRADFAAKWFALMGGWTSDKALADSVLAQSGAALNAANQDQVSLAKARCRSLDTTNVMLKNGGMTQQEAQKLIDLYNREGDGFLDGRYGQTGGPGSCGDNHAENCVSFSTYFLNKYTTFQHYPKGAGIETAGVVARDTGNKLSSTPTAYSVGSGPGTSSDGHTLVVLGIQGNSVIIGEANFCQTMGRVRMTTLQELQSAGWQFVDMSDSMLPAGQEKTS